MEKALQIFPQNKKNKHPNYLESNSHKCDINQPFSLNDIQKYISNEKILQALVSKLRLNYKGKKYLPVFIILQIHISLNQKTTEFNLFLDF